MSTQYDISVVIPAKDEEDRLPTALKQLALHLDALGISYEVIVVDDGSRDETTHVAKSWGAHVVNHTSDKGIAAAFRSGVKFSHGKTVMLCPADIRDFSFLREATQASQVFDVVSISKRHPRSIVVGYDRWRWFLSNGYQRCVNILFGPLDICTDTHYVKLYNNRILRDVIDKCRFNGPAGETEIMLCARDVDGTFAEIPAKIMHDGNSSKTSFTLILRTINELVRLWVQRKLNLDSLL